MTPAPQTHEERMAAGIAAAAEWAPAWFLAGLAPRSDIACSSDDDDEYGGRASAEDEADWHYDQQHNGDFER